MRDIQVYYNIGINISLHSSISILHYLLPDLPISHFLYQGSPFRTSEGLLPLVWIQFHDSIENCEVQAPDLNPRRPARVCYRSGFGRGIGVVCELCSNYW